MIQVMIRFRISSYEFSRFISAVVLACSNRSMAMLTGAAKQPLGFNAVMQI